MEKAGTYVLTFDLQETGYFNLFVVVENEHKQMATMDVSVHSNVGALFYLKWMILVEFSDTASLVAYFFCCFLVSPKSLPNRVSRESGLFSEKTNLTQYCVYHKSNVRNVVWPEGSTHPLSRSWTPSLKNGTRVLTPRERWNRSGCLEILTMWATIP